MDAYYHRAGRKGALYIPKTLRTAVRAYGMYESVYQVYARYSMITKTTRGER